jgi:hypothetical protein
VYGTAAQNVNSGHNYWRVDTPSDRYIAHIGCTCVSVITQQVIRRVETSRQSGATVHCACNTVAAVNTIVWVNWLIAVRVQTVADFRLDYVVTVPEVIRSAILIYNKDSLTALSRLVADFDLAGRCSIRYRSEQQEESCDNESPIAR